jgi:hypothetical protein
MNLCHTVFTFIHIVMCGRNKVYKIFVGISERIILKCILHCKAVSHNALAQHTVFMFMNLWVS